MCEKDREDYRELFSDYVALEEENKMSYMDDSCDPFGIPYTIPLEEEKEIPREYSFEDLTNLQNEERRLQDKLTCVKDNKRVAIELLTMRLKKYVDAFATIEIDDKPQYIKYRIITKEFKLSQLEKIKKDFNLKDIEVEALANGKNIINLIWE